jgi:Polyketide cyclase / dehydrase and lipid transport
MKSRVELEIDLPQEELASLFADPTLNTKWMHDIERYEPVSGQPGAPGSKYRLVSKQGDMTFVATVISNDLPNESRLRLDNDNVTVSITATYMAISPQKSRLVSEEEFEFRGLVGKIGGFFARSAIHKAHREHMESFKRFAER